MYSKKTESVEAAETAEVAEAVPSVTRVSTGDDNTAEVTGSFISPPAAKATAAEDAQETYMMDNVTDELTLLRLEEVVETINPIVQNTMTLRSDASWRSEASTPPSLRDRVRAAQRERPAPRSEGSSDERTTPRARGPVLDSGSSHSVVALESGEVRRVNIARYARGICMLDTGCVEAVGSNQWHADLQEKLDHLSKAYWPVDMNESFQFGPGIPLHATTRWIYPDLSILGCRKKLKMASVPADITGLVGPTEVAEWKLSMQFGGEQGD